MKVAVAGLWHLGTVTAACLASAGHEVIGFDEDTAVIANLREGRPPVQEPGLPELLARTNIQFTSEARLIAGTDVVWVAYDTPVDDDDHADVEWVLARAVRLFEFLADGTLLIVSSQLPVGSLRRLEDAYARSGRRERVSFACSPENLRLGKAIDAFMAPARVIAGVRSTADRERFASLLSPITSSIEWMSVESAEMTKHALNAFLALSVAFINEIAVVCEDAGADAKDVERALKTDPRIGPRAYLSPGGAFAGGTLARDVRYLSTMGELPLIRSIATSNDAHRGWPRRKLSEVFTDLRGRTVCVLGLTYKVGTDTLRRSASVELCRWLSDRGAAVTAHDPAITALPDELSFMKLCRTVEEATHDVDAIVVSTEWPEYRSIDARMLSPDVVVVDPNRFVSHLEQERAGLRYYTVGKANA